MLIVVEQLLDRAGVAAMVAALDGAQWVDGGQTAGTRSAAVKRNAQVDRDDPVGRQQGDMILMALANNALFQSATLGEKVWPPMFNAYEGGGHYGTHVDSALMRRPGLAMRSDISATLFLSDPDSYDGGELLIEGQYGAQAVKLPAGDMVLYPSSSLHQVTPVTRGRRVAAVTWIESAVADGAARAMLFDLDQSIQALRPTRGADDPDIDRLIHVYHNLLRRWARL